VDIVVISIRVTPSSSRTAVGGRRGDALVVRVTEAAVDGRATEAALRAIADAFDVPRRSVSLRTGNASRDKIVEVVDHGGGAVRRLAMLLGGQPG
jgi:uncharacterized protein